VTAEPLSNEELAGLRRACRKGVTAPDNRLAALTYREARGLLTTIDARDAEIASLRDSCAEAINVAVPLKWDRDHMLHELKRIGEMAQEIIDLRPPPSPSTVALAKAVSKRVSAGLALPNVSNNWGTE
jgi:hypothetical protein